MKNKNRQGTKVAKGAGRRVKSYLLEVIGMLMKKQLLQAGTFVPKGPRK
jgi:hypothetical protein